MKDISIYFKSTEQNWQAAEGTLGLKIERHTEHGFPELISPGVAIIRCPEYRRSTYLTAGKGSHELILENLSTLYPGDGWDFKLYDLGVIEPGASVKDTSFALAQVCAELIRNKVVPFVLGGSQDLTFNMYEAYQELEQMVNLTLIDQKLDLGVPEDDINAQAYISKILMHRPCYLFNCSVIGVQAPYVLKAELDLFEKLYFDVCRLGEYNADFRKAEPLLRNTDLLSVDMSAVRRADCPTEGFTPNGFSAEQLCQMARYAGISDKLTAVGCFNLPLQFGAEAAILVSEMIWYFLDGYANRKGDFPIGTKKDYTRFIVHLDEPEHELVFYKSPRSDRWWMEVPYPGKKGVKYERHQMVPCNMEDYEAAMKNELPDLWWKTWQKLS